MKFDAVLIAGPTASGKSALALSLAERLGGVIINTDSMQVYRELCILTARPSDEDMARAPHRLYGHVSVHELYSAGRYLDDARTALAEARAENRVPIFTGGTGLYFSVLTDGLPEMPAVPDEIHRAVRTRQLLEGNEALYKELEARDPETARNLRPGDGQRISRALEVLEATGRGLASWHKEDAAPVLEGLSWIGFVLDPPRTILQQRVGERFHAMIDSDVMEEVRGLRDLDPSLPAGRILGLRPLLEFDDGRKNSREAIEESITATRQYAKRQMTWFRGRMAEWIWLPGHEQEFFLREILSRVM